MSRSLIARLVLVSCLWPVGSAFAASSNGANDYLQAQTPAVQASTLAKVVGRGCAGKTAFYMGMAAVLGSKNQALWSLRCASGMNYAVEVNPNGTITAMECSAFQANDGLPCFKKLPPVAPPAAASHN